MYIIYDRKIVEMGRLSKTQRKVSTIIGESVHCTPSMRKYFWFIKARVENFFFWRTARFVLKLPTSSLSRYTGEEIYGSSLGAFAEESQEHKRLNRKLKNKKRTAEMVEEV